MMWPLGIRVGHTGTISQNPGKVILHADEVLLTPMEAREVAKELILRADFQDRTPDTYLEGREGPPRRR